MLIRNTIFVLFCILFANSVYSEDYYVASNGNDGASGAIGTPFKTFLPALKLVQPGDTIFVRGGTYDVNNTMVYRAELNDEISCPATSCPTGHKLTDGCCYRDARAFFGINDFSGWASNTPAYSVNSGTDGNPITIRNYGDEHPILDVRSYLRDAPTTGDSSYCMRSRVTSGCQSIAVSISQKAYWTIQGLEIIGGIIDIWGGDGPSPDQLSHDITITENNIHDVTVDGGDNPGLVRIDRADKNGAYNIHVVKNELHDFYDWEYPGQWIHVDGDDMEHFGAVTTLSACSYAGFSAGCTGYIDIRDNHIYKIPQAFYFKNAMTGPIDIIGNTIHNTGSLGVMNSSGVNLAGNLVYSVDMGWWWVGYEAGHPLDSDMAVANARNATIQYNTFIGLNSLLSIVSGVGHSIHHNIFFGMSDRKAGAGYETKAYITKSLNYLDDSDPANSLLQTITSDNNCFISPYEDFLFVKRSMSGSREFYNHTEALATFGFDPNSNFVWEDDPEAIFIDPVNHDYNLINENLCQDMGVYKAPEDLEYGGVPDITSSNPNDGILGDNSEGVTGSGGCNLSTEKKNLISAPVLSVLLLASLIAIRSRKVN